jgi:hypothetical protein
MGRKKSYNSRRYFLPVGKGAAKPAETVAKFVDRQRPHTQGREGGNTAK